MTVLVRLLAGDGKCFPRMELLSTSTQSILWPERIELVSSNGENPAREIRTDGETQIASIGVRERFRLCVAGGDAGRCSVRIASERPSPVNRVESGLFRVSEF